MYKYLFIALMFMFTSVHKIDAQEDQYKDLLFMIIDGDLEKALKKAGKYAEKADKRTDPVPFAYLSMAYYEISKRNEMSEDYPRAFLNAIKNASKFVRYDREKAFVGQFDDYLSELNIDVMREARYYFETENWRRCVTYAKYANKMDPDNLSAMLIKGVAEWKSRNEYQAKTTFEEAALVLANYTDTSMSGAEADHLRFSLLQYAKLMKEQGDKEKAAPYLDLGKEEFGDDPEFTKYLASY